MPTEISQRISKAFPKLSKGHKKIANAVVYQYEKVAYMTAAKVGQLVGVSESTVVRFASELGYAGYTEFQQAVQELVRRKLTPNQRIEVTKQRMGKGDILETVMESDISKIKYTLANLDKATFSNAVNAILTAKTVYIMGARATEPIAKLLYYNLSLIFDNIRYVNPTSSSEVFEQMFSIREDDVLIAFSFPRYSTKMVRGVKFAKSKGASVIVFTDSDISPLAEHATHLLTAQSDMASYMDSLVAPISIINAIVVEITTRCEDRIRERFDTLEAIWDEYEVYTNK